VVVQANVQPSIQDRYRRRDGALLSNGRLAATRREEVVRGGEALTDYRRLQCNHRAALGESVGYFRRELEKLAQRGLAPATVTASAAASTARSAASIGVAPCSHATQNAAANASPAPVESIIVASGAGMVRP
jgi:hypothetical protein